MSAYYNEIDSYAAQWLRNLMSAGLIMAGEVDERSIAEVQSDDLRDFTRCHFFAGIAGWDLALQLAGWPDDRPVWTGSCPCQPFSVAGEQRGFDDPRHLWPQFRRLIAERNPPVVFGEQVAGASRWLNLVRGDLEALDYAVGAIPIEAASADADHFRDRYWFVADHAGSERRALAAAGDLVHGPRAGRNEAHGGSELDGEAGPNRPLPNLPRQRRDGLEDPAEPSGRHGAENDGDRPLPDSDGERPQIPLSQSSDIGPERAASAGSDLRALVDSPGLGWGEGWTEHEFRSRGFTAAVASIGDRQYLECPDGKWRRLPPSRVRWLGTRIPARVAKLRAFGNAIDHRPAAEFVAAYLECRP